jgi:hypothetical protein
MRPEEEFVRNALLSLGNGYVSTARAFAFDPARVDASELIGELDAHGDWIVRS